MALQFLALLATPQGAALVAATGAALGIQVWSQTPAGQQAINSAGNALGNAIDGARDRLATANPAETCKNCDPCKHLACGNPSSKYRGGAHSCTSQPANDGKDSHHMPAKANSPLPPGMGPAIQMDPLDHQRTASYGRSPTDPYMQAQQSLIRSGNFLGAVAMDVADIQAKFPGKYDAAIGQMMAYAACLKQNGIVR